MVDYSVKANAYVVRATRRTKASFEYYGKQGALSNERRKHALNYQ